MIGLKNKTWTNEETDYLIKHYHELEAEEIAEKLGRTTSAIFTKANKMKLKKDTKVYSEKDVEYLRDNYEKPNVIIAEELGLHPDLIKRVRRENGIPKPLHRVKYTLPSLRKWDEETVSFIRENKEQSNAWFSDQLGLDVSTIRRIRNTFAIENPFTENRQGTYQPLTEYKVEIILKELGCEFIPQYRVGNYFVDFVIGNKAIEVHGDYWHNNPEHSLSKITERQERAMKTDKEKKILLEEYGFDVLWVWESEIEDGRAFLKIKTFLSSAT